MNREFGAVVALSVMANPPKQAFTFCMLSVRGIVVRTVIWTINMSQIEAQGLLTSAASDIIL